ncbi:ESX secretion-associated protein EspG [Pseudonocardia sp.]|uniref:ESX secretion-associated protein EspG n=1 Tax=Pseudonocardia sp. TaxID=60912 RepID=UPI00261C41BE|nr:ESX secretion-associated protein EspG [Pseudonocardia sp.]
MIPDRAAACVLTLTEFEVAWTSAGHEETPWQLDPPRAAMTRHDRARLVDATLEQLACRGLGDGRGPGRLLTDRFRCLAEPDAVLDMRARTELGLVAGVAAARAGRCVLATRSGGEITLFDRHPHDAIAALVELLGPMPPGRGDAVTVPVAAVRATAHHSGDPARLVAALIRHGVPRTDAETLARACDGVDRRAQFGSSRRRGDGRRMRRGPYVVGVLCGGRGQMQVLPAGRGALTVGPGDPATLAREIGRLATHG